ncbi:PREDICTED: floral homeotic protein PMADS 2-like [Fragaria vesca subsp. vesca]|uniref:floral homeotic protein PMADS 2-like n=1 Tax=Fragaria vesca subsp. vesca TaxID=101020 RepID=UPI0002C35F11|nr:PREDICTED: floral homeotic protein PMADS 2-like [Fragaria vesca subsp. vesca]
MGRGKIEIKRIENSSNRQVTYSKRRNGIIKKAKEITVLCDAKVSLIIINPSSGKMSEYCSGSQETLLEILSRYHSQTGLRLWDTKHENVSNELDRIKKENDNMQVHLRHLNGEDITSMNHIELGDLEKSLENGLTAVRDKKTEVAQRHRDSYKAVEAEHDRLNYELHKQTIKTEDNNLRDIEYQQRMSHMSFFRLQPIQPNLHHDC